MRIVGLLLFIVNVVFSQSNFDKGKKLIEQKKYLQAKPFLEAELKVNPKNCEVIDKLGEIAFHTQNWDELVTQGKLLVTYSPNNADYWYKYGGAMGLKAKNSSKLKALMLLNDIESAFLTSARLDKKHIETRWALVQFYTELPGVLGGSEKKAQQYANELMNLSKVDGYLAKGYIENYYKRYDKAETNYLKAHEIGHSKTTFEKLYDLYLNKLKDKIKADKLKSEFK